MDKAAERLVAGVRDDVVRYQCRSGRRSPRPIGGGPSLRRVMRQRAGNSWRAQTGDARPRQGQVPRPVPGLSSNVERDALRRDNVRATDEIVAALNERRILLAFEPVVETATRQPAFYECLMRIRRADGELVPASAVIPVAERLGLVRLLDHRVLELLVSEMAAVPNLRASVNVSPASTVDPDWWAGLGALLRANSGVAERLIIEITETAAIQDESTTRAASSPGSRTSAAASRSTISAPAIPRSATCASSAWTS